MSCGTCCFGSPVPLSTSRFVTDPSSKYRASLTRGNFYKKLVDVHGVPVVGSADASDAALLEVALTLAKMSGLQPQLLTTLAEEGVYIAIVGRKEHLTDIPAYDVLRSDPETNWDLYRGLAATAALPVNACAEENILCLSNDNYYDENICVHELAHTLAGSGKKLPTTRLIDFGDELGGVMDLDDRIREVHWEARLTYLWRNTYAGTNYEELWAEGVQSYYSVNYPHSPPEGDGIHNHIWHRSALEDYQPQLLDVIGKVFPNEADFSCPGTSMESCDCAALHQVCSKAGGVNNVANSEPKKTDEPTELPTNIQIRRPTDSPTRHPSKITASKVPTPTPSLLPATSSAPTEIPRTDVPTPHPSSSPITSPTTSVPTNYAFFDEPSGATSSAPSLSPTAPPSTYPPTEEVRLGNVWRGSENEPYPSDSSGSISFRGTRFVLVVHAVSLMLLCLTS